MWEERLEQNFVVMLKFSKEFICVHPHFFFKSINVFVIVTCKHDLRTKYCVHPA